MFDSLNYNLEILGSNFCAPTFFFFLVPFSSVKYWKIIKLVLHMNRVKNTCKKKGEE